MVLAEAQPVRRRRRRAPPVRRAYENQAAGAVPVLDDAGPGGEHAAVPARVGGAAGDRGGGVPPGGGVAVLGVGVVRHPRAACQQHPWVGEGPAVSLPVSRCPTGPRAISFTCASAGGQHLVRPRTVVQRGHDDQDMRRSPAEAPRTVRHRRVEVHARPSLRSPPATVSGSTETPRSSSWASPVSRGKGRAGFGGGERGPENEP